MNIVIWGPYKNLNFILSNKYFFIIILLETCNTFTPNLILTIFAFESMHLGPMVAKIMVGQFECGHFVFSLLLSSESCATGYIKCGVKIVSSLRFCLEWVTMDVIHIAVRIVWQFYKCKSKAFSHQSVRHLIFFVGSLWTHGSDFCLFW